MYSKVMMILWERWRRTYWAVIGACLLPLSGGLLYTLGDATVENAVNGVQVLFCLCFTLLIGWLLVGQCEMRNLDLAFPERLFRFPLRTATLLTVYMGYGVVAVAFPTLIVFGFVELFFEPISNRWTILLVLETVYIVLQTLSWLGGPARFLCIALSLAFVYTFLKVAAMFNLPIGINILCLIIILLCCGISLWSVSKYRHGGWLSSWQWVVSFLDLFIKRPSKHFSSPLQAQIWFEMRQTGYLFPLAALCFIGPMMGYAMFSVVYMALFNRQYAPMVPLMFGITIVAAFVAGWLVYGVFHRDYASGALSFWLRRPVPTRTLAVARLHAMMRSIGHVIAIFAVVALAVVAYDWAIGVLDVKALSPVKWALKYSSPLETVTMTVLGLYGFVLFYWILLWMALPLNGVTAAVFIIILLMRPLIGDLANSLVWGVLIIALPVSVLVAFYVARRRNLITTATVVYSACMFPVTVVSLWAFPWWLATKWSASKGLPILDQSQIILCIIAAILPFIPVVATPLLMDRLRHR